MAILDILNELSKNGSRLKKEAILKRESNNKLLKDVFIAAYNPFVNYYIRQIPKHGKPQKAAEYLDWGLEKLNKLSDRTYTGDAAKEYLADVLSRVTPDDAVVLERIIDRDLRCGATDGTANRVWGGLIPSFDVMLCRKDISKIKYPAFAQTKADGARCHLYFDGKKALALTRNGKEIHMLGVLDESCAEVMKKGQTLDGELVCFVNGKPLDRKTSNGIINKGVKGTLEMDEAVWIRFMAWDLIDFSSTIPYDERLDTLKKQVSKAPKGKIMLLATEIVNDEGEAQLFYRACRKRKEEGAILKNMKGLWVPKRTNDLGKMKAVEEADLEIIDWYPGEKGTKYEKMLGGLVMATRCRKLITNVGSGFSDEVRANFKPKDYLGKIGTVLYNEVISSKGKTTKALFLPRFVELRFDKDVANSLEELK
jgi:hypothetical protein